MGADVYRPLPRDLDARVRELLHLLTTAILERKEAIANEFRRKPPLRQFGDSARLGAAFPPPVQTVWDSYLETGALEPTGAILRYMHSRLVNYQDRLIRLRLRCTRLEERLDQLRNEWYVRQATGALASDPADQTRDARTDRAYRAHEHHLRTAQPDATRELEARFGASSLSASPPPPRRAVDFFDDELEKEFKLQRGGLRVEETNLAAEWAVEFDSHVDPLRMHRMGPSTGLDGIPVNAMPHPFMASKEAMEAIERGLDNYNYETKRKLDRWSYQLEKHHTDILTARVRANLASSARQYHRLSQRASEHEDENDIRKAERYLQDTLEPIQKTYEDMLIRAMERLSGLYEFRSEWDVRAHVKGETDSPLDDDSLWELIEEKEIAIIERDRVARKMRDALGKWGPQLALYDSLANRFMEASEMRSMHDADPEMETAIAPLAPRFLQLFMSTPWHERNHRGSLGVDEAAVRIQSWLVGLARTRGVQIDANPVNSGRQQAEPPSWSWDQNENDHWRPMLPHRIRSMPPLPTISVAAKAAVAALRRRALATRALR